MYTLTSCQHGIILQLYRILLGFRYQFRRIKRMLGSTLSYKRESTLVWLQTYTELQDIAWRSRILSWESLSAASLKHKLTLSQLPRLPSLLLAVSAKIVFWNTNNQSAHINHPLQLCFDFLFTHVLDSNKAFVCMPSTGRVVYSESQRSSDKLWGFKITTDHLRCGHLCFASELEFLIWGCWSGLSFWGSHTHCFLCSKGNSREKRRLKVQNLQVQKAE